ncbi:MAG: peptidylprolyl isomerase, partial [Saprospiraceae bacterium]
EMQSTDLNGKAKVQYVQIPFDRIEKNEIALSDDDFKKYLEENRAIYKTDLPTQTLEYTAFDILPTAKDTADIMAELTAKKADFAKVTGDDIQFFAEGEGGSSNKAYFKKDELSQVIADSLMGASVGQMFGPYKDGDKYKVARVLDFMTVPDSIQARHILRNANAADPLGMQAARDTIEMLKNMMETGGANFDTLALKYGQDGTSFRGGDLGTFGAADPAGLQPRQGTMVGPFNDLVFYEAEPKKFYTVETEFGVHLVQVVKRKQTGKKGVRVAYLEKDIIPSDATQKKMYGEALRFAQENNTVEKLRAAVEKDDRLEMTTTLPIDENGFFIQELGGGEDTRNMIKWANDASVGEVSPVVYRYSDAARYFDNKYVITSLSERTPEGLPSVAASKKALEGVVLNEKKGAMIASKITTGMDLNAVAGLYEEVTLDSADVAFKGFAPKIGNESEFLGALFALEEGQMTKPIIGNTGVFVGKMISKPAPVAATNLPSLKRQLSSQSKNSANNGILPALKKNTDIEDNRVNFF